MSTSATAGGGGGQQREVVHCHECHDEWYRDEHGLVCPECGGDFVEIVCSPSLCFVPLPTPIPLITSRYPLPRHRETDGLISIRRIIPPILLLILLVPPFLLLTLLLCFAIIFVIGAYSVFANHAPLNYGLAPFSRLWNIQLENEQSDTPNRLPRIPGGFSYGDSDGEDEDDHHHHHIHGTYSSTFLFEAPGIRIQRSTGSPLPPMGSAGRQDRSGTAEDGQAGGPGGPNMVEMLQTIFASIMGEQGMERVRQQQTQNGSGEQSSSDTPGAAGGDHAPQDPRTQGSPPPIPSFAGLFSGGPPPPVGSRFVYERHNGPPHRASAVIDDLPSFLHQLFGVAPMNDPGAGMIHHILGMPGVGPGGDYVWTEGQLDRVISELMEQHQGNAPPPAPPEVLNNLPKIKVDQKRVMEGEDCAVCKDDLILNEEVAQLPCRHVYHEDCIKRWLESRDTCPICRASTAGAARQQQEGQQNSQQQRQDGQQSQQQGSPQQTRRWFFGPSSRTSFTTSSTTTSSSNNNNSNGNGPSSPGSWNWNSGNNGNSR